MIVTDSTFTGNMATDDGGAIYHDGSMASLNSTSGKMAQTLAAAFYSTGGTIVLYNTIIAGNFGSDQDFFGAVLSTSANNLIWC